MTQAYIFRRRNVLTINISNCQLPMTYRSHFMDNNTGVTWLTDFRLNTYIFSYG